MAERTGQLQANGSAGFTGNADVAVVTGTPTTQAPTALIPWSGIICTSGAVANNQGCVSGPANYLWSGQPRFSALFAPGPSIAVQRIYIGLANTAWTNLLLTDTPGASVLSGAAFRYSTAAGDVNWKAMTFDGASQTIVDTGVPVVAGVAKEFEITDDGNVTRFKINGNDVAQIRSNRPAAAAVMRQGAGVQTLEAVAKACVVCTLRTTTN